MKFNPLTYLLFPVLFLIIASTFIFLGFKSTAKSELTKEIPAFYPDEKTVVNIKPVKKQIKHIELSPENTFLLAGPVETENSTLLANAITRLDNGNPEPLYLLIDSPGGSVFAGTKVISAIEASIRPVYTVCLGLCASMGAMIHSYGHKRFAVDRSVLMYHPAAGDVRPGTVPNMLAALNLVDRFTAKLFLNVQKRSKMTSEEFEVKVLKNIWVDAEDAKNLNLVDDLVVISTPGFQLPITPIYLKQQIPNVDIKFLLPDLRM
jgi:ATP-dependent Clp protease protease subunit